MSVSQDMDFYQFTVPKDNAWESITGLGKLGCIQMVDLNNEEQVFNLEHGPTLRRCEAILKDIENLEQVCRSLRLELPAPAGLPEYWDSIE